MTPIQHSPDKPTGSRGKQLDEGTSLALRRSVFAADRTLMAWIRTALSMISFGFTMVKLFEYLEKSRGAPTVGLFGRTWAPGMVGLAMMTIGTGSLVFAVIEHWKSLEEFRAEGLEKKWSLALLVAALVALLGVFALVTLTMGD
jgi:putative membrane protein